MNNADLGVVSGIAHNSLPYASALAQGILELYKVEYFNPVLYDESNPGGLPPGGGDRNNDTQQQTIRVFPNPANEFIDIQFSINPEKNTWFKLMNNTGEVVLQKELGMNEQLFHIQIAQLPAGMYFYSVDTGNGAIHQGKLTKLK